MSEERRVSNVFIRRMVSEVRVAIWTYAFLRAGERDELGWCEEDWFGFLELEFGFGVLEGVELAPLTITARRAIQSRWARRRHMAVKKPREEEARRKCRATVLVVCRCARRSGSDMLGDVRSMEAGTAEGRLRRLSTSQAMRSSTQWTEPVRELITSGEVLKGTGGEGIVLTWVFQWRYLFC